jgi:hypothetical protein
MWGDLNRDDKEDWRDDALGCLITNEAFSQNR